MEASETDPRHQSLSMIKTTRVGYANDIELDFYPFSPRLFIYM